MPAKPRPLHVKVNGANRHPRCSIPIPPAVCQSMLRKRTLRHVGSAGAAGACDTVISSTCGEPTSELARASACDESVDRTFLSRSVKLVEFPVEIRPKSSNAARRPETPTQPIGLAAEAVCLQRVYSDAPKLPFQKRARVSVWPVGVRVFEEGIKASRHRGETEACSWEFLF